MSEEIIELTTDVVASYVKNNSVAAADLPGIINEVHLALVKAAKGETEQEAPKPAVSVRRSVTPDHIICLEDGQKFKSLKRHIRTYHDMTPEQYREKWGLPRTYPMVAPNYAATRSDLAKKIGLGRKKRKAK
jgi:predicted transcriptional regulator